MNKTVYDVDLNGAIDEVAGGTNALDISGALAYLQVESMALQDAGTVTITGGTISGITDLALLSGGTASSSAATARTALGIQAASAELSAVAALTGTAILVRDSSASYVLRSIVGTTNEITTTDGGGVAGNPTLGVGSNVSLLAGTQTFTGGKTFSGAFNVDAISERTAANGVLIDGVRMKDSFLEMDEITVPASPAANKYRVYGWDDTGKTTLQGVNEDGTIEDFVYDNDRTIASIFFRQNGMLSIRPDSTTMSNEGTFNSTSSLAGGGNTLATGIDDKGVYRECRSVAISTSFPFLLYPANTTAFLGEGNNYARLYGAFQFDSFPAMRFFVGLMSTSGSTNCNTFLSSDNPNFSYVGLQYSNPRGDTNWQFVCGNSNVNYTVVDSGVAVTANTFYQFAMTIVSASIVRLAIYNQAGAELGSTTLSTNLPVATTDMGFLFGYRPSSGTITVTCRHRHFAYAANRFGLNNIP